MLRCALAPAARLFAPALGLSPRPLSTGAATLDLYQYAICPFCCKTKALLKFSGTPYTGIEVNPLTKAQFAAIADLGETEAERKYKKVPVAVFTDGAGGAVRVNGSDQIIARLLARPPFSSDAAFASPESLKWLEWSDTYLAVRIYPALTETFASSLSAFGYLDRTPFSALEKATAKYVGALAMVLAGGKIKKKYGLGDVNDELRGAVRIWADEALGDKQFEGGANIRVGGLGVYGVLKGLEAVEGKWWADVMSDEKVRAWYGRCQAIIGDL